MAAVSAEEWHPVLGYEGVYEVSSLGRVKSLERTITDRLGRVRHWGERILAGGVNASGYRVVALVSSEGSETKYVHVLVLEAFVGPRPEGAQGCHTNGDPADPRLENLRWDTPTANALDAVKHGRNRNANKKTCKYGHALRHPNLTESGKGRMCKSCHRARARLVTRRQRDPGAQFDPRLADEIYQQVMLGIERS